ncbi:hypothetical protein C3L33_15691, partial [Rhododendron williamsianum]
MSSPAPQPLPASSTASLRHLLNIPISSVVLGNGTPYVPNLTKRRFQVLVRWDGPNRAFDGTKLNTDGSFDPNDLGVGGGLLRDNNGNLIWGFFRHIGKSEMVAAELQALRDRLHTAWEKGITILDVEIDALHLIKEQDNSFHPLFQLISDCRLFLGRFQSSSIKNIFREANRCANVLAKEGLKANHGLVMFSSSPSFLAVKVHEDIEMLFSRGFSRISRTSLNRSRWLFSFGSKYQQLVPSGHLHSLLDSTRKDGGCRETYYWGSCGFHAIGRQIHHQSSSVVEDQLDPFLLVEHELSILANRLRSMVVAEVPKLASAAEYFFKLGVEGKRFRPTVLLLMATALNVHIPGPPSDAMVGALSEELRKRQQRIAEITEMIHVDDLDRKLDRSNVIHSLRVWTIDFELAWLFEVKRLPQINKGVRNGSFGAERRLFSIDIVLFYALVVLGLEDLVYCEDTRRGIGSLNFVMGNKLAVLAGDFLLSRACVALASLKNTEVVSLLATVVEHLVTGETMQMTSTSEQRCRYTAILYGILFAKDILQDCSLISNSCKAIALLAGQTTEVSMLAYEYGKNLVEYAPEDGNPDIFWCEWHVLKYEWNGLAFQLIDDILDFTGTSTSLGKGSLSDIRHVPYKVVKLAAFTRDLLKNTPLGWEDGGKQQKKFEKGGDRGCSKGGGGGRMAATRHGAGGDDDGQWCSRGGEEVGSLMAARGVMLVMTIASGGIVMVVNRWCGCSGGRWWLYWWWWWKDGSTAVLEDGFGCSSRGGREMVVVVDGHTVMVGIITAPILYAMEEFPQLRAVVDQGFDNPADVDLALDYLGKSQGIQRTRELAAKHATLASAAIGSLPESDDEDVRRSRRALVDLTHRVITRTK